MQYQRPCMQLAKLGTICDWILETDQMSHLTLFISRPSRLHYQFNLIAKWIKMKLKRLLLKVPTRLWEIHVTVEGMCSLKLQMIKDGNSMCAICTCYVAIQNHNNTNKVRRGLWEHLLYTWTSKLVSAEILRVKILR